MVLTMVYNTSKISNLHIQLLTNTLSATTTSARSFEMPHPNHLLRTLHSVVGVFFTSIVSQNNKCYISLSDKHKKRLVLWIEEIKKVIYHCPKWFAIGIKTLCSSGSRISQRMGASALQGGRHISEKKPPEQECIPVVCVPSTTVAVCQGEGLLGGDSCSGGCLVWGVPGLGGVSSVGCLVWGGCLLPGVVSQHALWQTPPTPCGQNDRQV